MYNDYSYYYDNFQLSSGQWFILFAMGILQIIANWRLFEKAGEAGWKSIIPFYNEWVKIKIANSFGSAIGWFIGYLIPGVNIIVAIIINWKFASRYTDRTGLKILYLFFPFVGGLIFGFGDEFVYRPETNVVYR